MNILHDKELAVFCGIAAEQACGRFPTKFSGRLRMFTVEKLQPNASAGTDRRAEATSQSAGN
jgi:hypothetical protein